MVERIFSIRVARVCTVASVVVLTLIALAAFNPASAATLTVNTTADSGTGSLRNAIAAAGSGDTIIFSLPANSTITLTTGVLSITQDLTISGPASGLTISGGGSSQVFDIASGTVNISGLTVSNGSSAGNGGGIYNEGALTLNSVTVSGNSAAGNGGGIYNDSALVMTNVTIGGNTATGNGGGIYNDVGIVLSNFVTISGNSAASGGDLYNNGGVISVESTIVANSLSGGNCGGGALTSLGYNLDDGSTCSFANTGDISGTNPQLGLLALNAPGTTDTFALPAGSPAIDVIPSGTNGCGTTVTTDQRGVTRPQGANCDIGAYEFVAAPVVTYTATPVPTMNEWGMIIFVALTGILSAFYLRRRRQA